ncbi:MAG: 3-oxoadipate enol-lactonase [Paracoccaceae bacterium]|nr:MAG: 3-oxoadipate enol-lactonase [Paracoccaceae bacterium]
MPLAFLPDLRLNYRDDGPRDGPVLVLAHALGLDLRLFDAVVPLLPPGLRVIRYDARGHGASDVPPAPYAMGALIRDAERLMDHLGVRDAVFGGVSLGGMVAQGLAVKRLDLVRGLILSNTAPKIATPDIWASRIATVRSDGVAALADATLARWFPRPFRDGPEARLWRDRLVATPAEGWCGAAHAVGGSDFLATTATLRLPALVIAGAHDGTTPPDLVRDLADLIPGSRFHLIRSAGHLPTIDAPAEWAAVAGTFLDGIGHAGP